MWLISGYDECLWPDKHYQDFPPLSPLLTWSTLSDIGNKVENRIPSYNSSQKSFIKKINEKINIS